MNNTNVEKLLKSASKKIRAERIALGLTQEEFSDFVDIKYSTYKSFEQSNKISFENYIKVLIKINQEEQFLRFLDGFEFNEEKMRATNKELNTLNQYLQPIIKVEQKEIVLDKKIFGNELFYSVQDGHKYDIPNFINIVLNKWDDKRLMLLIKYFGEERLKPHIIKLKDIKLLKAFNLHIKYIKRTF